MTVCNDISVLVLAAGRGTRFDPSGKRLKLLEKLPDGRTVIKATCEACLDVGFETVVVCGEHVDAIGAALLGVNIRLEVCKTADAGMGATLKHGLSCTRPSVGWIIMLGDMPGISSSTIGAVATVLSNGASLVRPYLADQPGHPVGISRRMERQFSALPDDEGGARIFRANHDEVVRVPSNDCGCVYDIDYPEHISAFHWPNS